MRLLGAGLVALVAAGGAACNPIGASCVSRQKTGLVASVSGTIGVEETVVHRLAYGTDGSQNNISVTWRSQDGTGTPRLRFYVTRVTCEGLTELNLNLTGACAVLARGGWVDGHIASTLIIANGRGNS